MAVGGLSLDSIDQAKEMVLAAKEMNDFVANAKLDDITTAAFDIRIGINTGPVVAGVVGTKKFAYDIWGDAVNIASRMESNSEAGRINISENTYQIVKSEFDCEYRGEIEVKNRGYMKMYFVNC
jgi:adenylate cyclase